MKVTQTHEQIDIFYGNNGNTRAVDHYRNKQHEEHGEKPNKDLESQEENWKSKST